MSIKYRIRKRKAGDEMQYYVDYKRYNENEPTALAEAEWMGGFYAPTEEKAMEIISEHRQYEDLRKRLNMTEDIIYDETKEIANG